MSPGAARRGRLGWVRIGGRVAMVAALLVAGNALYAEQRVVAAIAAAVAALLAAGGLVLDRRRAAPPGERDESLRTPPRSR